MVYADDSQFYITINAHCDRPVLLSKLQLCIINVFTWCTNNRLACSLDKIEVVHLRSCHAKNFDPIQEIATRAEGAELGFWLCVFSLGPEGAELRFRLKYFLLGPKGAELRFRLRLYFLFTRVGGRRVEVSAPVLFYFLFLFLVVSRCDAHTSRRTRNKDGR